MPFPRELPRAVWPPSVSTAGWLISVPLAGLAGARIAGYDNHAVVAAANAGTPFVYLPAYGALLAGILSRKRVLSSVAASLVVAHVVWTAPELRRSRPLPAEAGGGTRLRVISANIRFRNRAPTALGRELAGSGADILFLQELTPDHLVPLKEAGALDLYPYSYVDARLGSFGGGIWSRYPLSEAESWGVGGHPIVRAVAEVDGTRVRLFNVHAKAPSRTWAIPFWKAQLKALATEVGVDARPAIIAGDFNATYGHKPFRDLLASGLKEAHIEAGRGLATTWPRGGRVMPPVFRLDHVLVSSGLDVIDASEGAGKGSDHRPVVADLVLRPHPGLP